MPKISFTKPRPPLIVEKGANLMQSLLSAGIPVASSCYGDGICGKCRLEILVGKENLSAKTDVENIAADRLKIPTNVRLSCQCEVLGDVTVDATYW